MPALLDAQFLPHGNRQGLSLGWTIVVWLAHILSRADHRLNRVRPWADQLQVTLNACLPTSLRPTDLTDDRLADVLRALTDDAAWAATEAALNAQTLRVYDLTPATVRVDSTTASSYCSVTADGLFQFGHSKDHRPDLPQVKSHAGNPSTRWVCRWPPMWSAVSSPMTCSTRRRLRALRPAWPRLACSTSAIVSWLHCSTAPRCSRATTTISAHLVRSTCSVELLAGWVDTVLADPSVLQPIMRQDTTGQPLLIAVGREQTLTLTVEVAGQPVTWSERRLLVRSRFYAAAQSRGLMRRLEVAELALTDVLRVQHGKRRPTTLTELATAVETIPARYRGQVCWKCAPRHTRTHAPSAPIVSARHVRRPPTTCT